MIQHVLLENRLLLFGTWSLAQLVVIGIWSWRRSRAANRAVWIGLISLPALMVVSTLVVTTHEKLVELCHTLARHVEQAEAGPIVARLAADFEAADLDRAAFVERLGPALRRYEIGNIRLSRFGGEFRGRDRVTLELTASCKVRTADRFIDRVLTRWRIDFVRRADEWKLLSLEAIPTPFSPVRHLRDWIR